MLYIGCQFLVQPREPHMLAMNKVLQYIKALPSKGFYSSSSSDLQIKSYCDADWAGCPDTKRSLTGYSVFIGGSLISWRSKKQSVVFRSSAEAEYRAITIKVFTPPAVQIYR